MSHRMNRLVRLTPLIRAQIAARYAKIADSIAPPAPPSARPFCNRNAILDAVIVFSVKYAYKPIVAHYRPLLPQASISHNGIPSTLTVPLCKHTKHTM